MPAHPSYRSPTTPHQACPALEFLALQGSAEEGAVILLALMYGEDAAELGPWIASLPEAGQGLEWGALTDAQAAHLQCPELVRLMDRGPRSDTDVYASKQGVW